MLCFMHKPMTVQWNDFLSSSFYFCFRPGVKLVDRSDMTLFKTYNPCDQQRDSEHITRLVSHDGFKAGAKMLKSTK